MLADPDTTLAMLQTCARHQHPEAFGGTEIPAPPEMEQTKGCFEAMPEGCNREGTVWPEPMGAVGEAVGVA